MVPLDQIGASGRPIDCGDAPIEIAAGGTPLLISFDPTALDGYEIKFISTTPASDAVAEDLVATLEDPFSIKFEAPKQDVTQPRTEDFNLQIQWHRSGESAYSNCQVLVQASP